jgi:hypothetical protein
MPVDFKIYISDLGRLVCAARSAAQIPENHVARGVCDMIFDLCRGATSIVQDDAPHKICMNHSSKGAIALGLK